MRQTAFYFLMFLSINAAFGGQSIQVTGGSPSVTLPNAAPWTTIGTSTQPMRWELRIHAAGVQWPVVGFIFGPAELYQSIVGNWLEATNSGNPSTYADTFVGTNGPTLSGCCMGRTDLLLRVQRDVVNLQWTIEVYDTAGGNYLYGTATIAAFGPVSWAGRTFNLNPGENVAFVRWFSSVVPLGTPIPTSATGDLADWEFEGNLNDSSGHGLTMSGGAHTFVPTPVYLPVCNAGKPQSFRVGHPGTLDGTGSAPLDGGNTLTFLWQNVSGPRATWGRAPIFPPIIGRAGLGQFTISGQNTALPVITGLTPGSYTFQLTVTDGSGQSTACTVKDGAVETDDNGVVITNNPAADTLLGPMVRYGANPWPWFDNRHKADADLQIANMDLYYGAWWDIADAGTITVTTASTAVTGVGTTFTTTFCNGPAYPTTPNGTMIVVWYLTGNPLVPGETGRRMESVTSCQSDTQLTLYRNWAHDVAAGSGLHYADSSNYGAWAYNAAPANYYDNVAAFYALYYRSGLVDYLNAARKLADRFWECPEMDRGESYVISDNVTHDSWPPRSSSVMGLALRASDGRPDMWPGLEKIANYYYTGWFNAYPATQLPSVYDVRETAYALASISYCALYDPTSYKTTCQDWVNNLISGYLTIARFPDGSWRDFYGTTDLSSYVTLTNGQTTVTGVGTTNDWPQTAFNAVGGISIPMWFFSAPSPCPNSYSCLPSSNSQGDSAVYYPTWNSTTGLSLDRPYTGTTGIHGWVLGAGGEQVGYGALPYMEGLFTKALDLAARSIATAYPATASLAHGYSVDAARWIMNNGYRATTRSVYYAAGYVNCQLPIPEGNNPCTGNYAADSARVLNAEPLGGIEGAYEYSRDTSLLAFGDLLFNAMWAKPTTCPANSTLCVPDGVYVDAFDDGQWYMAGTPPIGAAPKYFGQIWGYPSSSAWPAYRLGGAQPAAGQVFYIVWDRSAVPGAVSVRATTRAAYGTAVYTNCTASPCVITAYGQGDSPAKLEYLSGSGAVLASGQIQLMQEQ